MWANLEKYTDKQSVMHHRFHKFEHLWMVYCSSIGSNVLDDISEEQNMMFSLKTKLVYIDREIFTVPTGVNTI